MSLSRPSNSYSFPRYGQGDECPIHWINLRFDSGQLPCFHDQESIRCLEYFWRTGRRRGEGRASQLVQPPGWWKKQKRNHADPSYLKKKHTAANGWFSRNTRHVFIRVSVHHLMCGIVKDGRKYQAL
ncbi:hypothetical protein PISMIDRAFT_670037 [Pisolithus microcarpus 441]|uniref:Uncharacterized protein n=1 Tax=Pisolithus microcarpus 441 TaxID=765257 RepID=A0A0D0AG92_9AGAM|nr:hypothetical protein PISMIDRAFT_670037 [Pisolithus microcarpus 441]